MENAELSGLIRRAAEGDVCALEKIFLEMKDSILAFSTTIVKSRHIAEDVLQETMLEVWKSAKRYQKTGSVWSWMLAIARKTAVDMLRRVHHETLAADEAYDFLGADKSKEKGTECFLI